MPRDVYPISENISPGRAAACGYDAPRRRLYDYGDSHNFCREHAYLRSASPQIARNKGRYISSDPIGIAGGLNTFGYVGQNPVNLLDPFGLDFWDTSVLFTQWASGMGPPMVKWGPDDRGLFGGSLVDDMKNSPSVNAARRLYKQVNSIGACSPNEPPKPVNNVRGDWDAPTMWWNANWTERFIGSYRIDIAPQGDGTIKIFLSNPTTLDSFTGGGLPYRYERDYLYFGGATRQVIWWQEKAP